RITPRRPWAAVRTAGSGRFRLDSCASRDLPFTPPLHRGSTMTSRAATEYRYEKLTWPEINDAVEMNKVCIVPCGAVEQHGPHLPLDVDLICPGGVATGAGRQIPEQILVLPTLAYGYTGHVMDFPGTINTHYETFIRQ